jgi:hypothetical protein
MQWGLVPGARQVPVAQAGYVHHDALGLIAHDNHMGFLDEHGVIWAFDDHNDWYTSRDTIPIPVSQIKFWSTNQIVTVDNFGWISDLGVWQEVSPWPGGQPVPTDTQSWGDIKNKYGSKED